MNWGRARDKSREGRVLGSAGLSIPLFDNERSDVVPGLLVVFGVGPVTVRELGGENRVLEVNRSRSYQVYPLCT